MTGYLPSVYPEPTKCKGWGHRNCMGHYVQPRPGELIHLNGPNFTRVSAEPGWFGMGYYGGDGRLTAVIAETGEEYIVRRLRDGEPDPTIKYPERQPIEWEAVRLSDQWLRMARGLPPVQAGIIPEAEA